MRNVSAPDGAAAQYSVRRTRHCAERTASTAAGALALNAGEYHDLLHQLCGAGERLLRQMRITLRRARVQVAEQPLHDVERDAPVDQEAGERMAQVVQTHVFEAGALADAV